MLKLGLRARVGLYKHDGDEEEGCDWDEDGGNGGRGKGETLKP